MPPSFDRTQAKRRRRPLPAQVITADDYMKMLEEKENEEKQKEQQKRKKNWRKRREKANKPNQRRTAKSTPVPVPESSNNSNITLEDGEDSEEDQTHCATCNRRQPPGCRSSSVHWVQCDYCTLWFHMICLAVEEAPEEEWLCHKCSLSV
ncbi:lysine-specific demethylase 5B-B-like [Acipenser ruthenus]|uniref:lysine-specific demethylase 5B-B-like n=1 Tax=Acipenser ruthenus TaxID=7906 RepID=UPI002740C3FB|nr:lysine-specific demethylase 5B-B-like [Acipenser ruthenus]